ncbi:MAG: fused MFS/spermidine synthase [Bdellovibrionota bacterium]
MSQKRKPKAKSVSEAQLPHLRQADAAKFDPIRFIAIAVTFVTGLLALVYEVAWHRYLANFLGSQAQAAATILAVFLGGLCIGYLVFGRISRSQTARMTLLLCGASEVGIGVWVLLFPAMYRYIWFHGVVVPPGSVVSLLWETGLSALLMLFPTVLMGGTLPLLTQGLSRDLRDSGPFHARVYAVNTAGAFLGCLLAGFVLLPAWGLTGTLHRLGSFNIIAGLILALIGMRLSEAKPEPEAALPEKVLHPEGKLSLPVASAVAFLAGFCSLTLQTIFIRLVGLSMGASEYAFCMVVAVFVSLLAFGAWCLSRSGAAPWKLWMNQSAVLAGCALVYFSIDQWQYWSHVVRTLFASVTPNFYVYHAVMFLLLWIVLAIPVAAMGSTMPLLFGATRQDTARLGNVVGRLYAWNTVGCALGALLGGYALLAYGDVDWIYRLCLVLMATSLLCVLPSRRPISAAAVVVVALIAYSLPDWDKHRLGTGLFRIRHPLPRSYSGAKAFYDRYFDGTRFLAYRDGPNTTVAVNEQDAPPKSKELNGGADYVRNLKVNGKSDGETSYSDTRTMRMTAHLPMLFSKHPVEHVAVVGFGLGITVGSVSLYPEVKDIRVVEISPLVKEFAHYFDFANYGVTTNPKVRWSVGDAYRVMSATDERYSLIVSEPSNPWVMGVERLFSKEYYEIVKRKLEPGGIYAQWIHDYTLSEKSWGLVAKTFGGQFPHIRMFRTIHDTIMLGSDEPLDDDSLEAAMKRYSTNADVREALRQVSIPDVAALLGLEIWVTKDQFPDAEVQTLEFPHLAHQAGFDFFMGEDLSLHDVLDTSIRRMWSREYAQDALILPYLMHSTVPTEVLESYARAACDVERLRLYPIWKSELKPCRDSLATLAVLGRIEPQNGLEPGEIALLVKMRKEAGTQNLADWDQFAKSSDLGSINDVLDLYGSYDSIFLRLSSEKIMHAAKPCLDGNGAEELKCRSHLVEVLAVNGEEEHAVQVFTTLVRDNTGQVGQERMDFLRSLIAEAERAARSQS